MTYDHRGEIAGRRATELEPIEPDNAMSKILTAAQVAEIKRDCNRGVYLGHGSTIEFCDSHEELRRQLEAKPSDAQLREENERLRTFAESVPGPKKAKLFGGDGVLCQSCGASLWTKTQHNHKPDCLYVRAQAALDALRGAETTEER